MVGEQPGVDEEVRCRVFLNSAAVANAALWQYPSIAQHCHASARGHSIFGKYLNVHLKFTVHGHKHGTWSVVYTHICAMQSR